MTITTTTTIDARITVLLDGKSHPVAPGTTLAALVAELGHPAAQRRHREIDGLPRALQGMSDGVELNLNEVSDVPVPLLLADPPAPGGS